MFTMSLKELLPQVITSWRIWVMILALVLFMYLVGYVSRTYHRPRISRAKPKRKKEPKGKTKAAPDEDSDDSK